MKILNYTDIEATNFDTEQSRRVAARVVIGKKDGAQNFCMRVFEFSSGAYSPRHSHDWEHEMFIHSGEGEFYNNGQWTAAKTGSVVFIPSKEEHQIRNRGNELLVIVCPLASIAPEI